jgi:CRISPR-associated protein Cmr1
MMNLTLNLELLTPCFAGGARFDGDAELRASSIRGQLRWWFRALGGFDSLRPLSVTDQETMVFGSASRRHVASPLTIRLEISAPARVRQAATQLPIPPAATLYFLSNLERNPRMALVPPCPPFKLHLLWHGDAKLEPDLRALAHVFGHLGTVGYRSRRGLGAWGFVDRPPELAEAWPKFGNAASLVIRQLPAHDAGHALQQLAQWLRKWRNYGRSPNQLNPFAPGLAFARKDHDAGLNRHAGEVFRPALGLPIHQRFQQGTAVDWTFSRGRRQEAEGGFASPICLRPYRLASQRWLALIMFFDSRQWPANKKVFLNAQPRPVSTALYDAMKKDPALRPFEPSAGDGVQGSPTR